MSAKPVFLYDTTLRDGTQGEGFQLSGLDKLRIAERLDAFGIDYIEGGWPGSNPKDVEFFREAKNLNLKHAKLAAFGSTRRADMAVEDDPQVRLLLEAETPVVTIFGKSWEMQVTEVLRTTVEENRAMIRDTVAHLVKHGREVVYDAEHFFDGYKDSPGTRAGHARSRGRRRGLMPRAVRHQRRHAALRGHANLPGGEGPPPRHALRHPHPQRLRTGRRQRHRRRQSRSHPDPGHHQRLWRTHRQLQPHLRHPHPPAQDGPHRGPPPGKTPRSVVFRG